MSDAVSSSAAPASAEPASSERPRRGFVRWLIIGAVLAAFGALIVYWRWQDRYPSTEDAYTAAHIVRVAAEVGGRVVAVNVTENQRVAAGETLFEIDPAPLQLKVESAQAQLQQAVQTAGAGGANVAAAAARLTEKEATLRNAARALDRTRSLARTGDVSQAAIDNADAAFREAQATVETARAEVLAAEQELGGAGAENARVREASAALRMAQLDLDRAKVRAAASGWVSDITLRPGTVVAAGSPLFALIEDREWWVDAHFKETDLERVRAGQTAKIEIDMYPGNDLTGRVDSISPGSGATFSLLPPENASGNWVKVTQRFTVRVKIDQPPQDRGATPLRVGASAYVRIDTESSPPAANAGAAR
jgi:membrane fusion protein (multidrug efflux system)